MRVVSALSVALYGMFLAIIIPPARKNRVVAVLVMLSFALSFACGCLPGIASLSDGTRHHPADGADLLRGSRSVPCYTRSTGNCRN